MENVVHSVDDRHTEPYHPEKGDEESKANGVEGIYAEAS
jgi:hypothetical protein